jgi:hypothetical protein
MFNIMKANEEGLQKEEQKEDQKEDQKEEKRR